MLLLLGVFFLDHLLKLDQFLAQLRKGLLYGIGFLSAFLSGTEIGIFCSVFLEPTAIMRIVRCERTPMASCKGHNVSRYGLSLGRWRYCQYQVALYHSSCCAKLSCCKKR
jgi:hypothetical protein